METKSTTYKPGTAIGLGVVLGGFAGLLVGKFAIGMIAGFFIGVAIDAGKRKASVAGRDHESDAGTLP